MHILMVYVCIFSREMTMRTVTCSMYRQLWPTLNETVKVCVG